MLALSTMDPIALSTLDPTVQGIFFLIAVVLFVVGTFVVVERINIVALGLAFFAFPFMWNAFAAS